MPDHTDDEGKLARLWARLFGKQKKRVMKKVPKTGVVIWGPFWEEEMAHLQPDVQAEIVRQATVGAVGASEAIGVGVDMGFVNLEALAFAKEYAFNEIKLINSTSQKVVEEALRNFITIPGYTRGNFEEAIVGTFGPVRAEAIAITETTRAYAEGSEIAAEEIRKAGVELNTVWITSQDDLVCPICAPLHGKKRGDGWTDLPPAHVRCRCDIGHEIA